MIAFTTRNRANDRLKSLARARKNRTLYKDSHDNTETNKNCSQTMFRSHNRPSSVVCICLHIQNCPTKLIMTSVVQYQNMVNQARQFVEILKNGSTRYIEQWETQLLTEYTAVKSMNSAKTRSLLPGASISHIIPLSQPCPVSFYF